LKYDSENGSRFTCSLPQAKGGGKAKSDKQKKQEQKFQYFISGPLKAPNLYNKFIRALSDEDFPPFTEEAETITSEEYGH
jgi:hypothetical protein